MVFLGEIAACHEVFFCAKNVGKFRAVKMPWWRGATLSIQEGRGLCIKRQILAICCQLGRRWCFQLGGLQGKGGRKGCGWL